MWTSSIYAQSLKLWCLVLLIRLLLSLNLVTGNVIQTDSNDLANQWQVEDEFCQLLDRKQLSICECSFGERLRLICDGANLTNSTAARQLIQTFGTLTKLSSSTSKEELILEELVLSNLPQEFEYLNAHLLPDLPVHALRVFNSPGLKRLSQLEEGVPEKMRNSLGTLEIFNTGLGASVFQFMRQFTRLNTVLLSDLKLTGSTLSGNFFRTGTCWPSLHRFVLNHRCSNQSTPIESIEPKFFSDLCNVLVLELSCLGLRTLEPGSLFLEAAPKGANYSHHPEKMYLDLSFNQLKSVKNLVQDALEFQTARGIDSVILNLDYNPIESYDQGVVCEFVHRHQNRLHAVQKKSVSAQEESLDSLDCSETK